MKKYIVTVSRELSLDFEVSAPDKASAEKKAVAKFKRAEVKAEYDDDIESEFVNCKYLDVKCDDTDCDCNYYCGNKKCVYYGKELFDDYKLNECDDCNDYRPYRDKR